MQANPTSGPPDFAAKTAGFFGRLGKSLDTFWQRVTEGLEIQALWSQFVADARESYSLYTREVDWEALQRESRWKRFTKTTSALFWAMILKLSPARRVFLLIALVFGILALAQTRAARTEQGVVVAMPQNFTFVLLSVGGLLFLLALELADRVTMKRDLEIAREIQRWLVPDTPPRVPGVDIAFASRPANTVGGDYYDAFLSDAPQASGAPGHLLLAVADVAGKSVPAALLMATFQASLRSLASRRSSLTELVVGINRYACAHSLGGRRFTTAFIAELALSNRTLTYVRAGHNAPVLRRASGALQRLDTGDMPLGIDPEVRYESTCIPFQTGDLLFVFTDGLIEAVNEKEEEFGEERMIEAWNSASGQNAEGTLKAVMSRVDAFVGHARQRDDVTCLILRAV